MNDSTIMLNEPTGNEYYNVNGMMSLETPLQDGLTLKDVIGRVDNSGKMIRLKTYILSIPQYKYLPHQRQVIELLVEGHLPVDISEILNLSLTYITSCIKNFRLHAKKHLSIIKNGGIL